MTESSPNASAPPSFMTRMRKTLEKNQAVVAAAAAAAVVVAAVLIILQSQPRAQPATPWPLVYAYDLNTKTTFAVHQNNLPPIRTESGGKPFVQPAGVWAHVYACGDCSDPGKRFVGWLEKFTPETEKHLQTLLDGFKEGFRELNPITATDTWVVDDLLIAMPDKPNAWVPQTSDEADAMRSKLRGKCGKDVVPVPCQPSPEELAALPFPDPMEDLANPAAVAKAPVTAEEPEAPVAEVQDESAAQQTVRDQDAALDKVANWIGEGKLEAAQEKLDEVAGSASDEKILKRVKDLTEDIAAKRSGN